MPTGQESLSLSVGQIDGYFKSTIMESVLALASRPVPAFALAFLFRTLTLTVSAIVSLLLTLLLLTRPLV